MSYMSWNERLDVIVPRRCCHLCGHNSEYVFYATYPLLKDAEQGAMIRHFGMVHNQYIEPQGESLYADLPPFDKVKEPVKRERFEKPKNQRKILALRQGYRRSQYHG